MNSIKEILMRRDGLTEAEANDEIAEAKDQLDEYLRDGDLASAENICQQYFGLEPDYVMELLDAI